MKAWRPFYTRRPRKVGSFSIGDVYSYNAILLELLSGKQLYREKREAEILDPKLVITEKSGDVELIHYLKIASQCLDDRPFKRPTMIQVMAMFKELVQVDTENDSLDEFSVKMQRREL